MIGQTVWCAPCRKRRTVMDAYHTDTGDSRGPGYGAARTRQVFAMPLDCGHDANDTPPFKGTHRATRDQGLIDQLVNLQATSH